VQRGGLKNTGLARGSLRALMQLESLELAAPGGPGGALLDTSLVIERSPRGSRFCCSLPVLSAHARPLILESEPLETFPPQAFGSRTRPSAHGSLSILTHTRVCALSRSWPLSRSLLSRWRLPRLTSQGRSPRSAALLSTSPRNHGNAATTSLTPQVIPSSLTTAGKLPRKEPGSLSSPRRSSGPSTLSSRPPSPPLP